MIDFVEKKQANWDSIAEILKISEESNHWSNFGPVSDILERRLEECLGLSKERSVILATNGTIALYALVKMHDILFGRRIRWAVSSFGFYCCNQGPLSDAIVVDCDERGMLDLNALKGLHVDGLIVTNPFGVVDSLDEYIKYCHDNNKILLCDSCSAFNAAGNHGVDEVMSFHHTKPWGFGEGGCAIVHRKNKEMFRSLINFGKNFASKIKKHSTNGKLPDTACAFILDRLSDIGELQRRYVAQYNRILKIAKKHGWQPLIKRNISHLPHCVPLIANRPVPCCDNPYVKIHKYYEPLADTPAANDLFDRIICVPCHPGVAALSTADLNSIFKDYL